MTDNPDRHRFAQRAVASARGDLQFFCSCDLVKLFARPHRHRQSPDQLRSLPSLHCVDQRPVLFSSSSGYRAPSIVIFEAALSISRRSSDVSSTAAAPMFSSRRVQLRGARDRNDPRLLGKQPGERDLSRCRLLPFCDLAKQINQGLIRFPSLRRKARDDVAEVGTVERRVFVDLSREEAFAQRTEWNEADPEFLERRQQFLFRSSPPQRVFALDCRDRLDGVCAADRFHSWLQKGRSA